MPNTIKILINAGLLVAIDGVNILVDPYSRESGSPYIETPDSLLKEMTDGKGGFGRIDILLITHGHPDHFDISFGREFLAAHPESIFIAPSGVVREIEDNSLPRIANMMIPLEKNVGGIKNIRIGELHIQAIRTLHAGNKELQKTENFSYYISGSSTLAIVGDAKPDPANMPVKKEHTDVVMAPYLCATLANGVTMIKESFNPDRIVFYHMPDPTGAEAELVRAVYRKAESMREQGDCVYIQGEDERTIIPL